MFRTLSDDERMKLGEMIARARAKKVTWKVLENTYGRSKPSLWRYMRDWLRGKAECAPENC